MDCYVTPACAALAIRWWMMAAPGISHHPFLDPFAGPGFMVDIGAPLGREVHAWDLDTRWERELRARVSPLNIRVGRDSLAMDWLVRGAQRPHILTNNPYGVTVESIERARDHAYTHRRYAALLLRVDFWHHKGRKALRPDVKLALEWRPKFAYREEKKRDRNTGEMAPTGRLVLGSDMSAYAWGVWTPERTGETREEFIEKPEVPAEMEREHARLAMMAYRMGAAMAQGERA
jgi:hypothetical protein